MKRLIRRTGLALAVAFALGTIFSGSASAQYGYYDDYSYGSAQQAHQYGYQNGFHDGLRKGRHEGRENDPGDVDVRALRDATHGYRRWMGPVEAFQDGYREAIVRASEGDTTLVIAGGEIATTMMVMGTNWAQLQKR